MNMNKKGMFSLIATLLTACMLTACSAGDAEDAAFNDKNAAVVYNGVFDGEWTVNKQVVDTARLEVTDVLKIRLPEAYLGTSCFEEEYFSSLAHSIKYKGVPTVIQFKDQGYSDYATFLSVWTPKDPKEFSGRGLFFNQASFYATINGVDYRVDLLSDELGFAMYLYDNGLWTIGFFVNSFLVTNLETQEEQVRTPHSPIPLIYNAKNRIR